MDAPALAIISIYSFGFIVVIVLLIYLIFRRIRIKEQENFEKRDN